MVGVPTAVGTLDSVLCDQARLAPAQTTYKTSPSPAKVRSLPDCQSSYHQRLHI
jgi:hypothetical protein